MQKVTLLIDTMAAMKILMTWRTSAKIEHLSFSSSRKRNGLLMCRLTLDHLPTWPSIAPWFHWEKKLWGLNSTWVVTLAMDTKQALREKLGSRSPTISTQKQSSWTTEKLKKL